MTLLVREYTYNNFLRKLVSERILIEMSGRVGQIKVKAPRAMHPCSMHTTIPPYHHTTIDSTTEHRTQAAGGHREAAEDGDDAVGGEYTMCPG
jgi:hypothetical protein